MSEIVTSNSLSCPAPITVLSRDYLAIVDKLIAQKALSSVSRAVRYCAAKLLHIFERLTKWKLQRYALPLLKCWIWIPIIKSKEASGDGEEMPIRSLYEELNGEHCRDIIRLALNLLHSELGVLDRRNDPTNGQNRTYQYRANLAELERLKSLINGDFQRSTLEDDPPTLEGDRSSSGGEVSAMITNTDQKNISATTETNCAEIALKGFSEPSKPKKLEKPTPVKPQTETQQPIDGEQCSAGGFPPKFSQFSEDFKELAIEANKTVLRFLEQFPDRVAAALATVRAKRSGGWMTNPSGVFVAALKKQNPPKESAAKTETRFSFEAPKARLDYHLLESACLSAFDRGDRAFVRNKLEQCLRDGFAPEVDRLCSSFPELGFVFENGNLEEF